MPLPTPNLDDRSFEELVEEIRTLIPRYNPDWTNFNPSDPGVTLLELFAYLAEQSLYRIDQVPRRNYIAFLRLLGIELAENESLESGIRRAVELVGERYRAVSGADFEELTLARMEELQPGLAGRAIVTSNADLEHLAPEYESLADVTREAHVSVVVVPRCEGDAAAWCDPAALPNPVPSAALLAEIQTLLEDRRLITTRVHAVAPQYRFVELEARVVLQGNTDPGMVRAAAVERVRAFTDPLDGGPGGRGWPAGRPLYRSEYYQVLEGTPGVDHVVSVRLADAGGERYDVVLRPWELVALSKNEVTAVSA